MGLDQYLDKELYVGEYDKIDKTLVDTILKAIDVEDKSGNYKHCYVSVPAIYWRKSNQIHKWFVDNCQDGNDNCKMAYVGTEQLENLLSTIKKQLKNKKKIVLEPTSGFFFGSTEIDEWYWKDLEQSVIEIERELKFVKDQAEKGRYWSFWYHSSW